MGSASQEAQTKLLAVNCLKAMKGYKTFRQLSKELKLPAGVLNRYINGYVLPKLERAELLISHFETAYLQKKVLDSARQKGSKYIVTVDILSQPFLLSVVAYKASSSFQGKVTKVFTAAVDGIPVAISVASFLGVQSLYAKQTQEISFSDHYMSKSSEDKPIKSPFYLPKNLLRKNDRVLIVDDVIRAGTTFEALTSICEQAKAEVVGIFALFIGKSAYAKLKKKLPVSYLFLVDD